MTKRLELPKFQAFDSNGDPLSGGLVYTYTAGTVAEKTTYSDYDASTANDNPVVLDTRGEADIYLQGSYKIVLKDSALATIWTLDNVQGGVGADAGGEDFYYPDATAADQGATGNSDTIKYAVDTISTDNGTIYLKHDSGTATTTYTLTTSETIGKTINFIIENGAVLDGAGTLTIYSPDQICAGENQQIFGSSITVAFTLAGTVYPNWWGAKSGNADDTAEVQAALDCRGRVVLNAEFLVSGVYIHPGTVLEGVAYHTTGTAYLNAGLTLIASSDPEGVLMTENVETGFASDFNMHSIFIKNIAIDGNRDNNTTGHGIYQVTSGFMNLIENVKIRECSEDGIHLGGEGTDYSDRATISNVGISGCDGYAIQAEADTGLTALLLESVKVDNCLGGIYINGGTGKRLQSVLISNYRSESTLADVTIMASSIEFNSYTGTAVINSAKFFKGDTPATRTGAGIKITGNGPRLVVMGAAMNLDTATDAAYTYIFEDTDNSHTIGDETLTFFASAPAVEVGSIFSRNLDFRYVSGDTGATITQWGNAYPRIQMNNMLRFGAGAAATDIAIWRDAENSLSHTLPTNQQKTATRFATTELTAMSGTTETWTNAIPAGSLVLGVTARVTTLITGATSLDVGISGGDTDLFIDGMSVALNTTGDLANSNAAFVSPLVYQSLTSILVTSQGGDFTAGALRLTLHYIDLGAAQS